MVRAPHLSLALFPFLAVSAIIVSRVERGSSCPESDNRACYGLVAPFSSTLEQKGNALHANCAAKGLRQAPPDQTAALDGSPGGAVKLAERQAQQTDNHDDAGDRRRRHRRSSSSSSSSDDGSTKDHKDSSSRSLKTRSIRRRSALGDDDRERPSNSRNSNGRTTGRRSRSDSNNYTSDSGTTSDDFGNDHGGGGGGGGGGGSEVCSSYERPSLCESESKLLRDQPWLPAKDAQGRRTTLWLRIDGVEGEGQGQGVAEGSVGGSGGGGGGEGGGRVRYRARRCVYPSSDRRFCGRKEPHAPRWLRPAATTAITTTTPPPPPPRIVTTTTGNIHTLDVTTRSPTGTQRTVLVPVQRVAYPFMPVQLLTPLSARRDAERIPPAPGPAPGPGVSSSSSSRSSRRPRGSKTLMSLSLFQKNAVVQELRRDHAATPAEIRTAVEFLDVVRLYGGGSGDGGGGGGGGGSGGGSAGRGQGRQTQWPEQPRQQQPLTTMAGPSSGPSSPVTGGGGVKERKWDRRWPGKGRRNNNENDNNDKPVKEQARKRQRMS